MDNTSATTRADTPNVAAGTQKTTDSAVSAKLRTTKGTAAARRNRRTGTVPGIVYGAGEPVMIELDRHSLTLKIAHEAFHSSVLNLDIEGKTRMALLRDVQLHPVSDLVLHVDFQEVTVDTEIAATVPVHYLDIENCSGVKLNHGIFSVTVTEVQVHCLPNDLPESLSVNVGHLEINQSVHLSELVPPQGVKFDALGRGEDPTLATVLPPVVDEPEVKPDEAPEPEEAAPEDAAEQR